MDDNLPPPSARSGLRKSVFAMTTLRNDTLFLPRWLQHYGRAFGRENLFVILDGHDQPRPEWTDDINVIRLPHRSMTRAQGDRHRARIMSDIARGLFRVYDVGVVTDVDEFLVLDPQAGSDLRAHLSAVGGPVVSALGLDVVQHRATEGPIDAGRPYLDQRGFAHVCSYYTKPVVTTRPMTWGSGMHRVKGHNFRIDPSLFLFHFSLVDWDYAAGKGQDIDRIREGWSQYHAARMQMFDIVARAEPLDGDAFFPTARRRQGLFRPWYAWNKPGQMAGHPIVRIPARFRGLV